MSAAGRFPPLGRMVAETLRDPERLGRFSCCNPERATIWLATGRGAQDWTKERPHLLAVILPDGTDPAAYRWDFLAGHDPVLLMGDDAGNTYRRRQIAAALFRDGVRRVLAGRVLMLAQSDQRAAA